MACPGLGAISAEQINGAASALGIPCAVVRAQLNAESGGQLGLTSSAGAQGPWQFLPSTFSGQGCKGSINNPADATACYVKYMTALLSQEGGSIRKALAAYNAGPGNLGAGYGYADGILSAAGSNSGATASGGTGAPPGGSPGAAAGAELAGFDWTLGTPFEGLNWFGKLITGTSGSFATIGDVAKSITGLTRSMSKFLELFALLFRPEFWLRVGAFFFGLVTLGAGLYFLKESLQS
jgi:hypothetical protein